MSIDHSGWRPGHCSSLHLFLIPPHANGKILIGYYLIVTCLTGRSVHCHGTTLTDFDAGPAGASHKSESVLLKTCFEQYVPVRFYLKIMVERTDGNERSMPYFVC